MDGRDEPLLGSEPGRCGRREQKRDAAENRDDKEAEKQIGETTAAPRRPDEKRQQKRGDEMREVHAHREHCKRPGPSLVQVVLEPCSREGSETENPVDVDLRQVMDSEAERR